MWHNRLRCQHPYHLPVNDNECLLLTLALALLGCSPNLHECLESQDSPKSYRNKTKKKSFKINSSRRTMLSPCNKNIKMLSWKQPNLLLSPPFGEIKCAASIKSRTVGTGKHEEGWRGEERKLSNQCLGKKSNSLKLQRVKHWAFNRTLHCF